LKVSAGAAATAAAARYSVQPSCSSSRPDLGMQGQTGMLLSEAAVKAV
jgi:hypothetical protein